MWPLGALIYALFGIIIVYSLQVGLFICRSSVTHVKGVLARRKTREFAAP